MEAEEHLKKLTGHKFIRFTESGDYAIEEALKLAKRQAAKLLIPDQSGWMNYEKLGKKLGFEVINLKTDSGIIDLGDLRQNTGNSAIIYQNPAGYFAEQPMRKIYNICKSKSLVILDASGSIGTEMCNGSYADIIICSFGKWKPLELGKGGFISSKEDILKNVKNYEDIDFEKLSKKINGLDEKYVRWQKLRGKIKKDLKSFEIIHRNKRGINLIVKYFSEAEKEKIIKYCKENNYPYTECPRYIRVMDKAISIEVKRL